MPAAAAPAGAGSALAVPGTSAGALVATDSHLADGSLGDDYTLTLTAGSPVTIVVRGGPSADAPGTNLDVYAVLLQNGVEVTHDDDSAGELNSRIVFTPTASGTYTLRVTTFGGGVHMGAYTVQTWAAANPAAV